MLPFRKLALGSVPQAWEVADTSVSRKSWLEPEVGAEREEKTFLIIRLG